MKNMLEYNIMIYSSKFMLAYLLKYCKLVFYKITVDTLHIFCLLLSYIFQLLSNNNIRISMNFLHSVNLIEKNNYPTSN